MKKLSLMLLVSLFGCQSGDVVAPPSETESLLELGCGISWKPTPFEGERTTLADVESKPNLYVISSDRRMGAELRVRDLQNLDFRPEKQPVHTDAAFRFPAGPWAIVINRLGGDNLQLIDKKTLKTTHQFSVGRGCNPADTLVEGNSVIVSRYAAKHLVQLSLPEGKLIRSLDLSQYADADGIPEMSALFDAGEKILLQLQMLDRNDRFNPTGKSKILVIDKASFTVEKSVTPKLQNSMSKFFRLDDGHLYLFAMGVYGDASDGGFEKFDGETFESLGVVMTEEELNGEPFDIVLKGNGEGYAVAGRSTEAKAVAGPDGGTQLFVRDTRQQGMKVIHFSISERKVLNEWQISDSGFDLSSVEWDSETRKIYVGERKSSRVLVFNEDYTLSESLSFDIPPSSLRLVR